MGPSDLIGQCGCPIPGMWNNLDEDVSGFLPPTVSGKVPVTSMQGQYGNT